MTSINEIITILKNRLDFLASARFTAVQQGDLDTVVRIDADILETQESLAKLEG